MKNRSSMQPVINAVITTGVGQKQFFFYSNMSYQEVTDEWEVKNEFPVNDLVDGTFIIKFSDGQKYLGSLALSQSELDSVTEMLGDEEETEDNHTMIMVAVGERVLNIKMDVVIYLRFNRKGHNANHSGTAMVYVEPLEREDLKAWFEEGIAQ